MNLSLLNMFLEQLPKNWGQRYHLGSIYAFTCPGYTSGLQDYQIDYLTMETSMMGAFVDWLCD